MFKVDDKVYDNRHGFGIIESITYSEDFPILATFDGYSEIYTIDGKNASFNANVCLFSERFGINYEVWKEEFENSTYTIE
ncbi:MAG: hypothetical protein ACRC6E_08510 [Fusobacteriaceae bacterium]